MEMLVLFLGMLSLVMRSEWWNSLFTNPRSSTASVPRGCIGTAPTDLPCSTPKVLLYSQSVRVGGFVAYRAFVKIWADPCPYVTIMQPKDVCAHCWDIQADIYKGPENSRQVQGISRSGGTLAGMLLARAQYLFKQVRPHHFEESRRALIQLALTTLSEMIKKLNKPEIAVQTLAHCEAGSIDLRKFTVHWCLCIWVWACSHLRYIASSQAYSWVFKWSITGVD